MSKEITPELFTYLVVLAALELVSDEADYLRKQMNASQRQLMNWP
jgi:hypothetical protein